MLKLSMHTGGKWIQSSSGKSFPANNPATGQAIAEVPEGNREDVNRAIAQARSAQPKFALLSAFDRASLCHRIAGLVESRKTELAEVLSRDQGKPYRSEAVPEVEEVITDFHMAAEDVKRLDTPVIPSMDAAKHVFTIRQPKGVYGILTPWNWPISISAQYVAPCLAAGNALVLVPALTTSACVLKLAECIVDADLPAGVFNIVTGPGPIVGDELVSNLGTDAIAFTGSSQTGSIVAQRAAGKSLVLELGGNGPLIVLPDADIEASAAGASFGCFLNAGQSCSAAERILVHIDVHEQFILALNKQVERLRLGDPFEETTTMGPLNNEEVAQKVDRHIQDAVAQGGRVLSGGGRARGFPTRLFYEPTVIDRVTDRMLLFREESFGPVAPITTFSSREQAVELANNSEHGLMMAVFTKDLANAFYFFERLHAGIVNINEGTNYWEPHTPFGGRAGKHSGYGKVGGKFGMLEMTDLKTILINSGMGTS